MFWCPEHERVADALFGSTAEMLTGKEALSRRIQAISDLVALRGLREPSRRGPKMDKIDWSQFEEPIDLNDLEARTTRSTDEAKSEDSSQIDELAFPTDQYIFCAGDVTLRTFHPRTKQRPDSLRRHMKNQYLLLFSRTDPVSCPYRVCSDTGVPPFRNREVWLNHVIIVHQYDLKIQLHRLASILWFVGQAIATTTTSPGKERGLYRTR
jgi:hypothetical protein